MNEALTLFREGGPWMYALLVLATGTPFLAVLLTFAAGSRCCPRNASKKL